MKRPTQYKISSILLLGTILIGYNQCVTPLGTNQKGTLKFASSNSTSNSGSSSNGAPRAISLGAFKTTVYSITSVRCVNCHGSSQTPLHASPDVNIAYDAVMNSSKVDFTNTANSRLYLKLKNENHNCWSSCDSNASDMLAQINNWKNATIGTVIDPTNTNVTGKTTKDTITVSEALNPGQAANGDVVTLMAESASLKTPMVSATENGTSYVWTAANAGIKNLTSTDAGTATLNFSVPSTDYYKVFMYLNASTTASDSVYAKVVGTEYKDWSIDATTGFQWRELTNTAQKTETEFYLTGAKAYQFEIRQKEPGLKISKVIFTNDLNYDPNAMVKVNQKATLTASLSDITGLAATYMDIDVEEFDLYSYKLTNPRIRTTKDLKIKKLKILVNGSFNPQHSTYFVVDKTVSKADPIVSTFSMILLKDKGAELDKLSFSFDIIEVVK
ncbi:MAG: hypothetical protein Q7U04_13540 [Bacteriovorax sp.]|nr:hypothetical protein [Bacteriovorax sp.]